MDRATRRYHWWIALIAMAVSSCATGAAQQSAVSPSSTSAGAAATRATASAPPPLAIYSAEPDVRHGGKWMVAQGTQGIICNQWLQLATERFAYLPAEVQQMANLDMTGVFINGAAPPNALLRKVPAALTGNTSTWQGDSDCHIFLQVTNTGAGVIQIPQVGWRRTRVPQLNREHYRLVDLCPLSAQLCAFGLGGGPTTCSLYKARIPMTFGAADFDLLATPSASDEGGRSCPPITLNSGQSVEIQLTAQSSQALTYGVEPVLLVTSSGSTRPVPVTDLAGTMPFADPGQFTCYVPQGTQFAAAWTGAQAIDSLRRHGGNYDPCL